MDISTIQDLKPLLPDFAKDLRVNLAQIEATEELTEDQRWGTVLAVAHATRDPLVVRAAEAEASARLDAATAEAARTAAAVMAMNNVYYRFVHLASNEAYGRMPARLRMQGLANHGVPTLDFELWALAVSAVNGCGMCIDSHERKLREEGASEAQVQAVVRIAAILYGVSTSLTGTRDAGLPASA